MNNHRLFYMDDTTYAELAEVQAYLRSKGIKCRGKSSALAYLIHRAVSKLDDLPELPTAKPVKPKLSPSEQIAQDREDRKAFYAKLDAQK